MENANVGSGWKPFDELGASRPSLEVVCEVL